MVVVVLLMVTCHMLSNTVSVGFECSLLTKQALQGHIRPINWCKPKSNIRYLGNQGRVEGDNVKQKHTHTPSEKIFCCLGVNLEGHME